jgi:two-component system, OmpR family, sensor histidine kinase VicK
MNNIENKIGYKSADNLNTIIAVVKITIMMFIFIIIYMNIPNYWDKIRIDNNGHFNVYNTIVFVCSAILLFLSWLIINVRVVQSTNKFRLSWVLENIFYLFIISMPAFLLTPYDTEYKLLFLLLIIISVIQYGARYGILTAFFSSVCILGTDLLYGRMVGGANIDFQKDLIVSGIFIFIAWILGFYVDTEAQNKIEKDKQLEKLSAELEEEHFHRSQIEELLLKNKVCYDILFENSVNSILVHENGKILYSNESAAKLLGYDNPLDLYGIELFKHYSEDNSCHAKEQYKGIGDKKLSKVIFDESIINMSGEQIDVRNTSSYFIYEGKQAVLTFLLDISSEKQIEILRNDVEKNLHLLNETREFNILITDFFTNISHELKTPINVIYVAIQAMNYYMEKESGGYNNKYKSYIKMMKQNCYRLLRLINNIIDITKFDSGFLKLNLKKGNIISVVEDITISVADYIKSKDVNLIFDTTTEELIMAFDHDKMERIILNLLSNAFKFTPPSRTIYVDIEDSETEVIIKIRDEGSGIPQDKLDFIFERFGQANRSLSREHEGSGIGLYLVKSFVELHRGKISAASSEGSGSEFKIVLPIVQLQDEIEEAAAIPEANIERISIEFSDIYSIDLEIRD